MGNMNRKLTRAEMIVLVEKIRRAEGTEEEIGAMVELFDANCLHPDKNGVIFWPVCTENSIRVDLVTELPIVNNDGRAITLLACAVRLAVQVEEPT